MNKLLTSPRSRQCAMGTSTSAPAEMYASAMAYRGSHQGMRPLRPSFRNSRVASAAEENPSFWRASSCTSAYLGNASWQMGRYLDAALSCYTGGPRHAPRVNVGRKADSVHTDVPLRFRRYCAECYLSPASVMFNAALISWVNSPFAASSSSDSCSACAPHLAT